jgi:hypothetical protein
LLPWRQLLVVPLPHFLFSGVRMTASVDHESERSLSGKRAKIVFIKLIDPFRLLALAYNPITLDSFLPFRHKRQQNQTKPKLASHDPGLFFIT